MEYIEKSEILHKINDLDQTWEYGMAVKDIYDMIKKEPAADVAPVVHGHWEKEVYVDPYGADWTRYHCSLCGRVEIKKEPYCNCGAKMDGD